MIGVIHLFTIPKQYCQEFAYVYTNTSIYRCVCVCVCIKGVHVHMYIYTHNYSVADLRTGSTEPSLYEVAYLILTPSLICKTIPTSKTTEAVLHCSNNSSKARFIWKECANCEL